MSVRVLLVDDHLLMRQGLGAILAEDADIELVGEAQNGREAIRLTSELRPQIVLMDLAMPDLNGIEATRQIKSRWPRTGVIALSSHADGRHVLSALDAGADAYVLKAGAYEELRRAVHAVGAGKRYLCADVAGLVVDATRRGGDRGDGKPGQDASVFSLLAPREREVLQLIAEGLSSGEIARHLSLAQATVDTHRRNLMRKVGLHNVADLTRYAIREGLVSPDG